MKREFSNTNPKGMTLAEIREEAYNLGHVVGYEKGYSKGIVDGRDDGYEQGYDKGFEEGESELLRKIEENGGYE